MQKKFTKNTHKKRDRHTHTRAHTKKKEFNNNEFFLVV